MSSLTTSPWATVPCVIKSGYNCASDRSDKNFNKWQMADLGVSPDCMKRERRANAVAFAKIME